MIGKTFALWQEPGFRWLVVGALFWFAGTACFVRAMWLARFGG